MLGRLKQFFRSAPAAPAKPRLAPAAVSPLAHRSNAEEVRRALPLIFQRTGRNFVVQGGKAASMDEALDETGSRPLPDVWRVQDSVPGVLFSWYGAHSFIGHQACAILAQHWLIAKACGQAPKDAVQNGFRAVLSMDGGEVPQDAAAKIDARNQEMDILKECREFSRLSRVFGIRHALFLVDGIDYAAPFNPDGVRPSSYRGIAQIDPYWISPVFDAAGISDPAGKHFYEPTWWKLPDGRLAHRSHFVIIREDEVPDVLKPTYYYGGLPLPQQIYERVYAAERTADEAPELAMTKRLVIMEGDIDRYITDENEVTERLHAFNRMRGNHGFMVVDQNEKIQQLDTSLADFDALVMTQYQLVAAIARTPATKLLGTSPKGFNATGEHESDSYDQELVSIQTGDMTPLLDRHHLLLCRSEFSEYPGLAVRVEWNPVRALKPSEKADLNLKDAQAAQARVTAQIIMPDEERRRLVDIPDGEYAFLAGEEPEDDPDLDGLDLPGGEDGETGDIDEPAASMDGFEESKIKRAEDGKFGEGGGGSESGGKSGGGDIAALLGKEHTGVKGQAAVDLLMKEQNGHVKGAFERRDIGKIDLAWGDAGFGLKHILQRRADQGIAPHRFVADLAQVIEKGKLRMREDGRYAIRHGNKTAIITPELRGQKMTLLLTAYATA
jgi:phage-related protein (TIGR01555 family)